MLHTRILKKKKIQKAFKDKSQEDKVYKRFRFDVIYRHIL